MLLIDQAKRLGPDISMAQEKYDLLYLTGKVIAFGMSKGGGRGRRGGI